MFDETDTSRIMLCFIKGSDMTFLGTDGWKLKIHFKIFVSFQRTFVQFFWGVVYIQKHRATFAPSLVLKCWHLPWL